MYKGIGVSPGYALGRAVIIRNAALEYSKAAEGDKESEKQRFKNAVEQFVKKTESLAKNMRQRLGDENAAILEGHIMLVNDIYMQDEIIKRIDEGDSAQCAVDSVCSQFADMFSSTGDEVTMQRAADIHDIRQHLVKILSGIPDIDISDAPQGSVVVVDELTPSMTASIIKENVDGILTEAGGRTSHSAILARALGIPCVQGIDGITKLASDGMYIALDGESGTVILNPGREEADAYIRKKNNYTKMKEQLKLYRGLPTETKDGKRLRLYSNVGSLEDIDRAIEGDAEGIGLFRTEFLFMESRELPSEEKQLEAYRYAAERLGGREVIIRTLDVGGDKAIPYLGMEKEENPFLGFRAVRYCLGHRDLYKTQLRAILRASAYGNISIMVPLVTCVDEIRAVKLLIEEIKKELDDSNIAYNNNIKTGIMVETPAASEIAGLLAKESDFFSIGTNDLIQYTMAADRGNKKLEYLYSVYNPAVLRSIERIIREAKKAGIMVGMCGEAAADKLLTPLLISFGLDEYSVSAGSVLSTRASIAAWNRDEAGKAAETAMALATGEEIENYLKSINYTK